MDQLTVDVSGIEDVQQGDTVTLIGEDGGLRITAGEIAKRTGTITNEIVCALGTRAVKQYEDDKGTQPQEQLLPRISIIR